MILGSPLISFTIQISHFFHAYSQNLNLNSHGPSDRESEVYECFMSQSKDYFLTSC